MNVDLKQYSTKKQENNNDNCNISLVSLLWKIKIRPLHVNRGLTKYHIVIIKVPQTTGEIFGYDANIRRKVFYFWN